MKIENELVVFVSSVHSLGYSFVVGASARSFSYSMDENWPGRFVMTSPLKMKKKNFAWDVHNREIIEWRMMTLLLKGYQRNVKNAVNKRIVQRMNPCMHMYVD